MPYVGTPSLDLLCLLQDLLTPKLAALLHECEAHQMDFNAAESLAMLVEDATVQQILRVLTVYADSLEAVRPACMNNVLRVRMSTNRAVIQAAVNF